MLRYTVCLPEQKLTFSKFVRLGNRFAEHLGGMLFYAAKSNDSTSLHPFNTHSTPSVGSFLQKEAHE